MTKKKQSKFQVWFGVQGVLAIMLTAGYVVAVLRNIALPDAYTGLLFLTYGFYFAKNGRSIIDALRR